MEVLAGELERLESVEEEGGRAVENPLGKTMNTRVEEMFRKLLAEQEEIKQDLMRNHERIIAGQVTALS